ncbi:type III-A CRISPR-associated RAMP protein Csm3 [Pectobacterium colocasium]|uniref:type III-A CRISPR-associated RAMP protein Csm3 n=1 Tax=Pectobacterium TaxID=122277 RepID=UPI00279F7BF5|nr:type III-A CRISPR-associated RAMP protein Csm3 [Pectobacterium sp. PL152]WED69490.1 type III-A CRISPR-associated RAMP protein Csm3 [Pectobacterium colocasium]
MQLKNIQTLRATLVCETGLHIGGGDTALQIGGIDSAVVRHPLTQQPYIPGSSLKGKLRSLLEWRAGVVGETEGKVLSHQVYQKLIDDKKQAQALQALKILQLFGVSGGDKLSAEQAQQVGPTRLSFWDCEFDQHWLAQQGGHVQTEEKAENCIDRISGVALHPRFIERVPAGSRFDFRLTVRQLDGDSPDLLDTLLAGLKMLELDGLGGSISRGYGKVRFEALTLDGEDLQPRFEQLQPFATAPVHTAQGA